MRSSRRGAVTGESFAQVNNPDPFAPPVWRSPVYRTPEFVIWLVQLVRLAGRALWFVFCHPLLDLVAGLIILDYLNLGWPGLAGTAALIVLVLRRAPAGVAAAVHPVRRRAGAGRLAVLVLPAPVAGGHDHHRPGALVPGAGTPAGTGQRRTRAARWTGSRSSWSPASPRTSSPTGPTGSPTVSACIWPGSAPSPRA